MLGEKHTAARHSVSGAPYCSLHCACKAVMPCTLLSLLPPCPAAAPGVHPLPAVVHPRQLSAAVTPLALLWEAAARRASAAYVGERPQVDSARLCLPCCIGMLAAPQPRPSWQPCVN